MGRDAPRKILVALEGMSGVGKTTVSRALGRRLGAPVVPEAFDRLGQPSLEYSSLRELADLELRLARAECERFQLARGTLPAVAAWVILDTGFLGPLTYTLGLADHDPGLTKIAERISAAMSRAARRGAWGLPDITIYLDAPRGVLARRVGRSRHSHPPALWSRHWTVGRWERRWWTGPARYLMPGRVRTIPASGRAEDVVERIARSLGRRLPGAAPSPAFVLETLMRDSSEAVTVKR